MGFVERDLDSKLLLLGLEQRFPNARTQARRTRYAGNRIHNPASTFSRTFMQRLLAYAVATLQLPNVSIYIDAAHAGWLGWSFTLRYSALCLMNIHFLSIRMARRESQSNDST